MLRCSSLARICIFANFKVSSNCGVLSNPCFLAASDMAIIRGHTEANCFFNCGVTLGLKPLASFSNSALVMTVLQSAAGLFSAEDVAAVAGFAATPLAEAGFGCGAQIPLHPFNAGP